MTTFAQAVLNIPNTRTTNGMAAYTSTNDALVDLFFNAGASRGKNILPTFEKAYNEDAELACRTALWLRDARGGAGERKLYRDILEWVSKKDANRAIRMINKTPILGRWDDIFCAIGEARTFALEMVKTVLYDDSFKEYRGLLCKWLDRKGLQAVEVRKFLGLTPKQYRKLLVRNTKVVENYMCAREWQGINYSHVPSVAASRYQKAFNKHDPEGYAKWKEALVKKTDPKVKVNAGALYPYDVIKSLRNGDQTVANEQWKALPDYVGDASIIPLVDCSGSMGSRAGGYTSKTDISCLDVGVSLGLYLADKNKGKFKDIIVTFTSTSKIHKVKGNSLKDKYADYIRSAENWMGSTNLESAFNAILSMAVNNDVPQSEMPETLLIISDMQFNQAVSNWNYTALQMIKNKYEAAGYTMPKIVFWNLNASYGNAPATSETKDVGLVSGFSPAIVKSILSAEDFTPKGIMLKTVLSEKYDF